PVTRDAPTTTNDDVKTDTAANGKQIDTKHLPSTCRDLHSAS
ncbi:TPA: prepilin-type cleavage/methylation domain-containing protein, partial [Neisseria meningitidis]